VYVRYLNHGMGMGMGMYDGDDGDDGVQGEVLVLQ